MVIKSIYKILLIAAFIVFLFLVIPLVLFTPNHVESKISADEETLVDTGTPIQEPQITGLFIEFEGGTTESEVEGILENYNIPINYSIEYNSEIMQNRYYITVDENKSMNVKDELRMEENWTTPEYNDILKKDYYIITVPEQIIHDESFLSILEKNNLQVKNSVLCFILFGDGSKNGLPIEDAFQMEDKLKVNKKILTSTPEEQVVGLFIEFENGTTELEVKDVLESYKLTMNTTDYNIDYVIPNYYIIVDKDKMMSARSELGKVKNWNEAEYVIKKEIII